MKWKKDKQVEQKRRLADTTIKGNYQSMMGAEFEVHWYIAMVPKLRSFGTLRRLFP